MNLADLLCKFRLKKCHIGHIYCFPSFGWSHIEYLTMSTGFETELILSRPYLTRKQITRAQKNTISDLRSYTLKKLIILKYLSDICVHLKLPRKTLETAIYYYERYHLFNNFETELIYAVATSCLVLSCKQTETLKKVNEICVLSFRLRKVIKVTPEMLENLKKRIFQIELRILEACSFDYRINNFLHTDEYIVKIGKALQLDMEICHLAWLIAFDSLKLDVILIVPQHTIAMASLKIAYEIFDKKDWPVSRYNEFNTDEHSVNEAYFEIINFYMNTFDICELKDNIPVEYPPVSLEKFIELKRIAGTQRGLNELSNEEIEMDPYLNASRSTEIKERRHVLSSKLVIEESNSLNNKN